MRIKGFVAVFIFFFAFFETPVFALPSQKDPRCSSLLKDPESRPTKSLIERLYLKGVDYRGRPGSFALLLKNEVLLDAVLKKVKTEFPISKIDSKLTHEYAKYISSNAELSKAIHEYQETWESRRINDVLRSTTDPAMQVLERMKPEFLSILHAFDSAPKLPGELRLYRGARTSVEAAYHGGDAQLQKGETGLWRGFSSTSVNPEVALEFAEFREPSRNNVSLLYVINLPKAGSPGLQLVGGYETGARTEQEILLPPETQFRVLNHQEILIKVKQDTDPFVRYNELHLIEVEIQ